MRIKEKEEIEFVIRDAFVAVYEDSYEEGEGKNVNSYDLIKDVRIKTRFSSMKDLIKEISSVGFSGNVKDYDVSDDDDGRVYSSFLGDENNYPVTERDMDYKLWKNGEKVLYANNLSMTIEIIQARPLTYDEGKAFGFSS